MIVYFSGQYFTLRRNTLYSENFDHLKKTIDKSVNNRKLYQSSLRKTFVFLDRHFHVILHYFEPWILNEYFELLTTESPVFIESQLRGDLCKSGPGQFASEKSFPSNFAQ